MRISITQRGTFTILQGSVACHEKMRETMHVHNDVTTPFPVEHENNDHALRAKGK